MLNPIWIRHKGVTRVSDDLLTAQDWLKLLQLRCSCHRESFTKSLTCIHMQRQRPDPTLLNWNIDKLIQRVQSPEAEQECKAKEHYSKTASAEKFQHFIIADSFTRLGKHCHMARPWRGHMRIWVSFWLFTWPKSCGLLWVACMICGQKCGTMFQNVAFLTNVHS